MKLQGNLLKANLKAVDVTYAPAGDSQIVDRSEKVLTDSSIGGTFVGLGLARIQYMDVRSEERRVGKECRSRWSPYH